MCRVHNKAIAVFGNVLEHYLYNLESDAKVCNGYTVTTLGFKDTVPIFRAEFGDFGKCPRDQHNEVNDTLAYGV